MKTSIEIRNAAYFEIAERLPLCRKRVYQAILTLGEDATNKKISELLEIPINRVTGRVSELRDSFLIQKVGEKELTNPNLKHCIWGPVKSKTEREALIRNKIQESISIIAMLSEDLEDVRISKEGRSSIMAPIARMKRNIQKLKQAI